MKINSGDKKDYAAEISRPIQFKIKLDTEREFGW